MSVRIVAEQGRHLAVTRFEADLSTMGELMGRAFGTVAGHLARTGVRPAGPAMAYYEIRPDGMSVAAGFPVSGPIEGDGTVVPFRLPSREVITTEHVGPYEQVPATYEALHVEAEARDRKIDESAMWEEYLAGPDVPPEQMRTVVSWPLE
ncbi:GyrI-like domain-containing protein [Nocardioides aquiterrae]|uniref:AraC effector-binding domain-containing protein n=1 Tax=Nocardioides aquiterrae TaxID=203799 RepID=A0ABN1UKL1_9ACTN